jgi:hypothetical protein
MVNKIAISLSKELDTALKKLSADRTISKSRLIEVCLRENPDILREINNYQLKEANICELCKEPFKADDIKVDTPKYGVICKDCWADKMGELTASKPISDA